MTTRWCWSCNTQGPKEEKPPQEEREIAPSYNKKVQQDLVACNEAVDKLRATSSKGIHYRRGVEWHNCVICAVSDAGHANASEYIEEWDEMEPFRSQGGKLIFLASPDAWAEDEFSVVLLSFGSNALKRVVRSTIQAEAYNLQQVVEDTELAQRLDSGIQVCLSVG